MSPRRRQFLRRAAAVSAAAGLAGCPVHSDPVPKLTLRLEDPRASERDGGWRSRVHVLVEGSAGVGADPEVRKPRVVLFDGERAPIARVGLPVLRPGTETGILTPPADGGNATPAGDGNATSPTADPAGSPRGSRTAAGTPSTAGDPEPTYGAFSVPAEKRVDASTAAFPRWIGFQFAEVRGRVKVDVVEYVGPTAPSSPAAGDDWSVSTHEYGSGPLPTSHR